MNGSFGSQTSGFDWSPPIGAMLLEVAQHEQTPPIIPPQTNIFKGFEEQMKRHDQEHLLTVADLAKNYVMPRDHSINAYLSSHRALPQILIRALPHLREHFGERVLALRANSDDQGWERLYVDVLWPGSPEDAFAAIDRFQDAWWIAQSHLAAGYLTFTYRLV